jgi:hypothetical protein
MASADFSLRVATSPFQALGEISPGKNTRLHRTTAGYTPPRLGHKSFAAFGPLALLGSASYPVLVHRLTVYDPRVLPTVGHPSAVALHFVRCSQLTGGLAPPGVRPCRAHKKNPAETGLRLALCWRAKQVAGATGFCLHLPFSTAEITPAWPPGYRLVRVAGRPD